MIPKLLHQIWLGNSSPNPFLLECKQSVIEINKGWEYMYHTNTNILDHPKLSQHREALRQFEKVCETCNGVHNQFAIVADLCRIAILYVHGGIYLDHDMYAVKPLDRFLSNDFVLTEIRAGFIGEGCIGAYQESPEILDLLLRFIQKTPGANKNLCMGLTSWAKSHNIKYYPMEYFCPHAKIQRHLKYRCTPNTHTIHCWKNITYDLNKLKRLRTKSSRISR
jgi:mannosyltransferase OCH1-like enzyme